MPGGDGTGPRGMGSMTGRAAGFCAGYNVPGFTNPVQGRGFWRAGRGNFGGGRGWRHMYYATGLPYWARFGGAPNYPNAPQNVAQPNPEQEVELLKNQAEYFEGALEDIKKRIDELEAQKQNK